MQVITICSCCWGFSMLGRLHPKRSSARWKAFQKATGMMVVVSGSTNPALTAMSPEIRNCAFDSRCSGLEPTWSRRHVRVRICRELCLWIAMCAGDSVVVPVDAGASVLRRALVDSVRRGALRGAVASWRHSGRTRHVMARRIRRMPPKLCLVYRRGGPRSLAVAGGASLSACRRRRGRGGARVGAVGAWRPCARTAPSLSANDVGDILGWCFRRLALVKGSSGTR